MVDPISLSLGALSLGSNIIGSISEKKRMQQMQREQDELFVNSQKTLALNNARSISTSYPANGIQGSQSFAMGGKLDMGIGGDMMKFKGASHEQGGINFGNAEVEGGETYQPSQERVFSDRIKPSEQIIEMVKNHTGVYVKNGTYADISEKLAKRQKDAGEGDDRRKKDTIELTNNKVEQGLSLLFEDQQSKNNNNGEGSFAMGGKLKYNLGGQFRNPLLLKTNPVNLPTSNYSSGYGSSNFLSESGANAGISFSGNNLNSPFKTSTPSFSNPTNIQPKFDISKLDGAQIGGQLANLGQFIGNRRRINNLQINRKPVFAQNPIFSYKDNSKLAKSELNVDVDNTIDTINRTSSQNNAGAIGRIKSEAFKAKNTINSQSAIAENNARNQYNQEVARVQQGNVGIANQAQAENMQRYNERESLKTDANNAFVQGVIGNIQVGKMNQLEQDKMLLNTIMQGDRGTAYRFLQANPDFAKRMKLDPSKFAA